MTNINRYNLQTRVICDSPQGEGASQVALVVKNLSANAGDMRDVGWIPEVGRSRSRAWQPTPVFLKTPMDREPSGLQSVGSHRVGHNWSNLARMHIFFVSSCSRSLCPGASSLARDPGSQPILVVVSVQTSIRTQAVWLQVYLQHYTGLSLGG